MMYFGRMFSMLRFFLIILLAATTFSNAAYFNFYEDNPDWKKASAEELSFALEQYEAADAPKALASLEMGVSEIRRRVALHDKDESRYAELLVEFLLAKVHYEREVHFAGRTQPSDEALAFERTLPAYQEANRVLSEALQKYAGNVRILRLASNSFLPAVSSDDVHLRLLSTLVTLDKTDFFSHSSLIKNFVLRGDVNLGRVEAVKMLKKMLALGDSTLLRVPFDESTGELSMAFSRQGLRCVEMSTALAADFALLPEQFHTKRDRTVGPDHFNDAGDRREKIATLRQMIQEMINDLSASSCGRPG